MCQKSGVKEINWGDLKVTFGAIPGQEEASEEPDVENSDLPHGLTAEQLMFYSAPPGE